MTGIFIEVELSNLSKDVMEGIVEVHNSLTLEVGS